jgi:3-hydroxyacyl-CoA dehydrogenase
LRRIGRFRRGERRDFAAHHREDRDRHGSQYRAGAFWHQPAFARQICPRRLEAGPQEQQEGEAQQDEDRDRRNLEEGEPEFELAIGLDRHQIGQGHHRDQRKADRPDRHTKPGFFQPRLHQLCPGDGLYADHDDPEIGIEPTGQEPGPISEAERGVFGKRAMPRPRHRHFAQHPHDEENQKPRAGIAENDGRPGDIDRRARADEQPRADNSAERDHRHMP